jgi:hypothetical protein
MEGPNKYITSWGTCSYCHQFKHGADTCDSLKRAIARGDLRAVKFQNKLVGGGRLCGYCAGRGHSSSKCDKRFDTYRQALLKMQEDCDKAFTWLHEIGFGPGAMLSGMSKEHKWSYINKKDNKADRTVIIGDFTSNSLQIFLKELLYGAQRNWFEVDGVDTSMEKVRQIYLPFHPLYSPRPTSVKVEVVHRSNPEDIDSLKLKLECYVSPVIRFATAKDFFDAGYKFKSGTNVIPDIIAPLTPKA